MKKNKKIAKKLDKYVFSTFKITIGLTLLMSLISYFVTRNFIWVLIVLLLGFTTCLILISVKGGTTGKRYAQGAKNRRKKYLPIFYKSRQKNKPQDKPQEPKV